MEQVHKVLEPLSEIVEEVPKKLATLAQRIEALERGDR
jgi:hypothetical protein